MTQNSLHPAKALCFLCAFVFSVFALNAQNQNAQVNTTKYGLISTKASMDSRLMAANNCRTDYVRETQLLSKWDGISDGTIDYWISRKKKMVLNINNDSTPSYFPTNLTTYKSKLNSFLDVYGDSIKLAVIENEELNDQTSLTLAHYGSMQSYINELSAAVTICNQRHIPVTNGGLTSQVVASLKHYYEINGKQDSVAWLNNQMNGVLNDSMRWKRCDSLLNAYRTMPLTYVNLHWYEPKQGLNRMTGVLQTVCNFITQQTGKKVVTNETGIKGDSSFVTQLLQQWGLVNPDYLIFFDGTGGFGGLPITTATGALMPPGVAFRDFVGGGKACSQSITLSPSGVVTICSGDSVTITASGNMNNYLWNTGQTTSSIKVKTVGNFWVKSNQKNCVSYSNTNIGLNTYTKPTTPTITATPSPPVNICPGKNVQLSSSPANSYSWSTGEKTKNITVRNAGNYTVTIADGKGCKSTSVITTVSYKPCSAPKNLKVGGISLSTATLSWTAEPCAMGYQVQYHIKGLTPWTTMQLTNGATTSKTIYNLTAALYEWRMLTDCSFSPDTIKSAYVYGPNFTIGGLKNESNALAANLNGFDVKVFPVPAKNVASVSVSHPGADLQITLIDVYGKILWQKEKVNSAVTNLPVANLAAGTYMVVVKDNEHSKTLWLIKQ